MSEHKLFIEVTVYFPGLHCWLNPIKEVDFLSYPHRHTFKAVCRKEVHHDNRDIEFLLFQKELLEYIKGISCSESDQMVLDFGELSCEAIAIKLLEAFDLLSCIIYEDGEVGAGVYA